MTIDELASMPYWNIISTFNLPRNVFARIQMATDILHWVFWSQGIEEFKRVCGHGEKTFFVPIDDRVVGPEWERDRFPWHGPFSRVACDVLSTRIKLY